MAFSFTLNKKEYLKIILLQVIIAIPLYNPIANVIDILTIYCINLFPIQYALITTLTSIILLLIPITLCHELIHALACKILGGCPTIGFKGIYAYTMEQSGIKLSRTQFLIVLMAPVVIMFLVCAIMPWGILKLVFYLEAVGIFIWGYGCVE